MHNRRVILLGIGGHGSVVFDALHARGICVDGIIDPAKSVESIYFGVPVLGGDEWLDHANPKETVLVNGIGVSPGSSLRSRCFNTWKQRGFDFVSVQHPCSVVGREAIICEGSQIMAGSVVQCRANIGVNVVINTRSSVDHDCKVGMHVFIGPGVTLCGDVCIGDNVFIGAGAIVLPGITIGSNAIVGAGAVVTHDVPCGELTVGNPAIAKKRFSQ